MTRITLTDAEWMSLIDGSEARTGNLFRCCANVSALRDAIISVARNGGEVGPFAETQLRKTLGWVQGGHDIGAVPALRKLCFQLGITGASLTHESVLWET